MPPPPSHSLCYAPNLHTIHGMPQMRHIQPNLQPISLNVPPHPSSQSMSNGLVPPLPLNNTSSPLLPNSQYSSNNCFPLVYWFPSTPPVSPPNQAAIYHIQSPSTVPWVLILRNAPLGIKKSDILQFFSGYEVLSDYIQIHSYNESYMSDAFVTFSNRNEAERALMAKNYQKLGSNSVELFLAA